MGCWKRISTIKNKVEKWEWGVQECGGRMFQGNPHWEGVSWTSLKERGEFCHEDTQGKGISQGRNSQCKEPMVGAYWGVWTERKGWVRETRVKRIGLLRDHTVRYSMSGKWLLLQSQPTQSLPVSLALFPPRRACCRFILGTAHCTFYRRKLSTASSGR